MGQRGVYRGVFSVLLDDPDFQALSAPARHTFLTLRLCAQAGPACIFRFYSAVLCAQTGYSVKAIERALTELEKGSWLLREGPVIWLRNALRYDPYLRLSDTKHMKAVEKWISGLPRVGLVLSFCDYYQITRPFDDPSKDTPRPFDDPAHRSRSTEYRIPNPEKEKEIAIGEGGGKSVEKGGGGTYQSTPIPPRSAHALSEDQDRQRLEKLKGPRT